MAYKFAIKTEIKYTAVSANKQDLPVALTITDGLLATTGNGGGIHNTDSNGGASGSLTVPADFVVSPNQDGSSPHDFEIVSWNSSTGQLETWAEIDAVSASSNTPVYLVGGDSGEPGSQENVSGTWGNGFEGVWHLGEGGGTAYDSSGNDYDASDNASATGTSGQVGDGQEFDGSNDYYNHGPSNMVAKDALTFACWFKYEGDTDSASYVGNRLMDNYQSAGTTMHALGVSQNNKIAYFTRDGTSATEVEGSTVSTGTWYQGALTVDGNTHTLYLNTNQEDQSSYTPTSGPNTTSSDFGGSGTQRNFDGHIDEVRISSVARDSHWISISYENQNAPSPGGNFWTAATVIMQTSVSLGRNAGDTEAAAGTFPTALSLARSLGDTEAGLATALSALSLARSLGDTEAGVKAIYATLSLARTLGDTEAGLSTALSTLSLARILTDSETGLADTAAALSLARTLADSEAGQATALSTLSLARTLTDTETAKGTFPVALTLARQLADTEAGLGTALAAVALARTLADTEAGLAGALSSLSLGRAAGDTEAGVASAGSALSLARDAGDSWVVPVPVGTQPLKITIASTDRTANIPAKSITIEDAIGRQASSARFAVEDGGAMSLAELDEVIISTTDGSTRYFAGYIRKLEETATRGVELDYRVECVDYTWYLDHAEGLIDGNWSSKSDQWIIQNVVTTAIPDIEVSTYVNEITADTVYAKWDQATPRQVLDDLAEYSGGEWYVDYGPAGSDKAYLHYYSPGSDSTEFDLSDDPNYITTAPYEELSAITEAPDANRVIVVGDEEVEETRTKGAEGDYGWWLTTTLENPDITTAAQAQAAGDQLLTQLAADPSYTCYVRYVGLRAGQTIHLTNSARSIDTDYTITRIATEFVGPSIPRFRLELGKYIPSLPELLFGARGLDPLPPESVGNPQVGTHGLDAEKILISDTVGLEDWQLAYDPELIDGGDVGYYNGDDLILHDGAPGNETFKVLGENGNTTWADGATLTLESRTYMFPDDAPAVGEALAVASTNGTTRLEWRDLDDAYYAGIRYQASPPTPSDEMVYVDSDDDVLYLYDGGTSSWIDVSNDHDQLSGVSASDHHDPVSLAADAQELLTLSTQELGFDTQTANTVLAGPGSGAAANPTFRALVANDIPSLSGTYITEVVAGSGLTGGGSSGSVTLNVGAGTGIGVNANDVQLSHLGIESLSNPGADRGIMWDNSATATDWWSPGTNLSFSGNTLNATAGSEWIESAGELYPTDGEDIRTKSDTVTIYDATGDITTDGYIRADNNIYAVASNVYIQVSAGSNKGVWYGATGNLTTAGYINSNTGFRVSGSATAGNVLRGNGTNFVSATLALSDLSDGLSGTDNQIVRMDGTDSIQASSATVDDSGYVHTSRVVFATGEYMYASANIVYIYSNTTQAIRINGGIVNIPNGELRLLGNDLVVSD